MSGTKVLALVLIVVGALMLAYPAITYTERDKVVDLGPVEVTKEDTHRVPLSPVAGGVAIVAGIVLMFMGSRRTA
jgi:UDP-N-acetylmuramyl pentapeptide phosphotransferase/UDP-N-acetylglucosamine-1-phosphate transferase